MNGRSIYWMVGMAVMLGACSEDDLTGGASENGRSGDSMETYEAKVRLVLPLESMPAFARSADGNNDPQFAHGTPPEYSVDLSHTWFEFFDDRHYRIRSLQAADFDWSPQTYQDGSPVTLEGTVRLHASMTPSYLVVFANTSPLVEREIKSLPLQPAEAGAGVLTGKYRYDFRQSGSAYPSADDLKRFVRTELADDQYKYTYPNGRTGENVSGTGRFLMLNATYFNNGQLQKEIDVRHSIYKVGDTPKAPVVAYLERVVSKVDVTLGDKNRIPDAGDVYRLENGADKVRIYGCAAQFGVKLTGWTLNAVNRSFIPLKHLSDAYPDFDGTVKWKGDGRTYWAEDGNYQSAFADGYPTNGSFLGHTLPEQELYYETLNHATNAFGDGVCEYCLENTLEAGLYAARNAMTQVLIAGKYTDHTGKVYEGNVYRLGGAILTETELKAYLAKQCSTVAGITADDFEIVVDRTDWKDRAEVRNPKITCRKELFGVAPGTDVRTQVLGNLTLWVYIDNVCYYVLPVKHFEEMGGASPSARRTGYYGVVRNHWYKLAVKGVDGFGHPADPNKPIIPEELEDDEYILKCDIKVLAWGKKQQEGIIGGTDVWK